MKRTFSIILIFTMLLMLFAACTVKDEGSPETGADEGTDYAGIYTGTAPAYNGELSVDVELDSAGKILSVTVDENHGETQDVGTIPIESFPEKIVSEQSLKIDAVTGATVTSDSILAAVADALSKAGLNPEDYGFEASVSDEYELAALDLSKLPEKAPVTGSIELTDSKGRQVTLETPISSYAISTMDVIDYMIPLLGEDAFHKLVASGQDGGHGLNAYAKLYTPIIGNYMEHVGKISEHNAPFDLEMILAVNPDVLIVNSAMGAHNYALEIESQLEEAGIPIVLIDVPGKVFVSSAQETIRQLGEIFQVEERAEEVASFIDEQFDLLASKNLTGRSDMPTVYYEKSGYAEVYGSTSTSKSGWGAVIAAAGGENIADSILLESATGGKGSNSTLDPEYVLEADPDFIVLSGSGAGWMDNFEGSAPSEPDFDILNRTGWEELSAVKNGNVFELAHASSRSIFGFYSALKLATKFYPDEFTDFDPEAVMDEFFQRFMLVDSDITGWFFSAGEVK